MRIPFTRVVVKKAVKDASGHVDIAGVSHCCLFCQMTCVCVVLHDCSVVCFLDMCMCNSGLTFVYWYMYIRVHHPSSQGWAPECPILCVFVCLFVCLCFMGVVC